MAEEKPQVRDLRNGNWYWANKQILENKELKTSGKIVYSALAYFSNETNQKCYPSIPRLMKLTDLTRPTIIQAVKRLEKEGFIRTEKQKGKVTIYYLLKIDQLKNLTSKKENGTSKKEDATSKKEAPEQSLINNLNKQIRVRTNKKYILVGNEYREVPVGDPPPGTGEKPNPEGIKKLAKMKKPLLQKMEMRNNEERTEDQEIEAKAQRRLKSGI